MAPRQVSRAATRAVLAAAAATLLACATATFHGAWQSPAAPSLNLSRKRIAALVLSEEKALRHGAEDALAREITTHGGVGIPSYTLLPRGFVRDGAKAREILEKARVEGVVELRPRAWDESAGERAPYWNSPRYASFWGSGFWGWGWGWEGADRSYLPGDPILVVETLVYILPEDELVWASQSRTMGRTQVARCVRELSARVGAEMARQGLFRDGRGSATDVARSGR